MSEEQTVTYELEGEIALVGLNRPDKRNCFNPTVMKQLRAAIERAGEEAKCGIIFGHGDNFCAGLDLRWAAESWKTGRSERLPFQFNRNSYFEVMARGNIPSSRRCTARPWAADWRRPRPRISASPTKPRSSAARGNARHLHRRRRLGSRGAADRLCPHAGHDADRPRAQARRSRALRHRAVRRAARDKRWPRPRSWRRRSARMRRCRTSPSPTACRACRTCLRRRPVLRAHGGGIHPQPGVDRAAAPVPRQDRAARRVPE